MKLPTRLLIAGTAAAVLPLVVPGFDWLIHSWFGRVIFTFALVFLWCTLIRVRPYAPALRERSAMNGAMWSIVGGLLFTFVFTIIFPLAHVAIGAVLNFDFGIRTGDDLRHAMAFFAIACFTVTTTYLLRKNHVI